MATSIDTNPYQTQLTEELLNTLNQEIKDDLFDYINNIEFIKRLISPNRPRAKDRPRDHEGKIIVDVVNPHILENMDYFRQATLYHKEHGVYTHLRPNANPNSEFGQWVRREIDRIWYGMVRPEDGEWVTGDMYFYLNYTPIIQSKIKKGTKIADRIVDFPAVWEGVYLWYHYINQARHGGLYNNFEGGNHCVEIAKRGASKSYTCASMLARLFVVGDNPDTKKEVISVITAYLKDTLTKDGTLNKFEKVIDFCAENTQFPSKRVNSSLNTMFWKMGYEDVGTGTKKGTLNEVIGVTAKDNVDKARGKRCSKFIYEEFGAFPKFIDTWTVNKRSVQEGDYIFGTAIAIGTGGSEGSNFYGALEMIYNPVGYNVYAIPNVFDKNSQGKQNTVFFFGAYLNRLGHYNEDGVSDVIGALIEILKDRYKVKYNTSDPLQLTRTKAEDPITIQEAIMKRESTIYPVSELTDRVNELDISPKSFDDIYVGRLELKDAVVVYKPSYDDLPIRDFPHKDNKLKGAIEIHKLPEKDSKGNIYNNRYIGGIDPYDDDQSNTLSLGSIYILDLWTDQIVCEYTGRPMFADDFYEICRKILIFYDARANYENNKKGLFKYFSQYNSLYLLTDTLDFLKEKDPTKVGNLFGNKAKGTQASAPTKAYARRCIRDWLLKPIVTAKEVDGVIIETTLPQLTTCKSRALIKELIIWNPDGNFDRHDALGMVMLLREDKLRLLGNRNPQKIDEEADKNYLGNDDFFSKNYRASNSIYAQRKEDSWMQ